jgi:hypothetical protein
VVSQSGQVECRFAQDGCRELDASSRRTSEMARDWRGLCPAVDCSRLMMMIMMMNAVAVFSKLSSVSAYNTLIALTTSMEERERWYYFVLSRTPHKTFKLQLLKQILLLTAGWSSGLRSRLRNQQTRVEIPVVTTGFCDEQLYLLTSHGFLFIYARRTITEANKNWSVIGWVTKNFISRAPPCFERHVKSLVPAVYAVVSTHQSALGPRGGLWPVLLVGEP